MAAASYPTIAPQRIENNLIFGNNATDSNAIKLS